jgi:glycine/D-amino acid oxidase-like deaminating enzyme
LPFHHLKGEILDLETSLPDDNVVYNRGVFLFNNAQNEIRCGSTYEWREVNLMPTEKGKTEILDKLSKVYANTVEVKRQRVGIRPSTLDRRPFVGIHPEEKLLGIFNGLGTKGVSLAPYFAVQFCEQLMNEANLDNEVDISRYFSIYWNDKEEALDAD